MTESRQHSTQTNQNKVTNSSIKDTTIQNSPETAAPSVALTAAKPQGFLRSLRHIHRVKVTRITRGS